MNDDLSWQTIAIIKTIGKDGSEDFSPQALKTKKQRELTKFVYRHKFFIRPRLNKKTVAKVLNRLPKESFSVSGGVIRLIDKRYVFKFGRKVWVLPKGYKVAIFSFGGFLNYTRRKKNESRRD